MEDRLKKQIVIFGGCFNPPLNSHFWPAQQLINEYNQIEKIIFVPVNSKYQKAELIGNEDRYNMLKLVCDKNEKFEVSRMEIDSPRPLYTIETLENFQIQFPDYEIAFTTGSDNLKELNTWNRAEDLVKNFKFYIIKRDKDNIEEIISNDKLLSAYKKSFIVDKNHIISNLSSTYVRANIKEGKSINYLAPEEVVKYIEEHKLYKE